MKGSKQIGEYTLLKEIGKGNFSVVFLGAKKSDNRKDSSHYAVKCINKAVS